MKRAVGRMGFSENLRVGSDTPGLLGNVDMSTKDADRQPDFAYQYAIHRRSKPVQRWHAVEVLMVGTDMRGAKRLLEAHRKDEPDAEYRLVRRPANEWEPVDA